MPIPYTTIDEATQVGSACGYTYMTGGRLPLTVSERDELAGQMARACCMGEEATVAFIASFQYSHLLRARGLPALHEPRCDECETWHATHVVGESFICDKPRCQDAAAARIAITDQNLATWWEQLGTVPVDADGEHLDAPFSVQGVMSWPAGTHREEVWHWFDERHTQGVHALMFPDATTKGGQHE